jgi:hypothetical protein
MNGQHHATGAVQFYVSVAPNATAPLLIPCLAPAAQADGCGARRHQGPGHHREDQVQVFPR